MSAQRTAGRVASIRRTLSDRDIAILSDVGKVRLLHAAQIQRLHFCDGSPLSRARRSRRVLRRLHETGLLVRLERRVGGVYAGSAGYIYSLAALGQRLLGSDGPAGGSRRRKPWEPSAQFQDHVLEVSEIYVQLRELETATGDVELLSFDGEPRCWRTFTTRAGISTILKPDAYVRLGVSEYEQVSFVEVDRGTEHMPTIRRKLAVYTAAFDTGVETGDQEIFPNVLWIAPDSKRAAQLSHEIQRLTGMHRDLFEVTSPQKQITTLKGGKQ